MKRLIKRVIFFLIPFCVSAQSDIFRSNINPQGTNSFIDITTNYFDTTQLSISSRFFGVGSFNNKQEFSNTYLLGLSFDANIKNKLMFIAYYDYLDGDYNSGIKNYQDSLTIYYPGFGLYNTRFQFNAKYLANKFIIVDIGH